MHVCKIATGFRDMTPYTQHLLGFLERFERIENLDPVFYEAVTAAFASLMLTHYQTSADVASSAKKKRAPKKTKIKKTKGRHKKAPPSPIANRNGDDDDNDDDTSDNDNVEDDSDVFSADEKRRVDIEIDASLQPSSSGPRANINGVAMEFAKLFSSYTTFVNLLQPTFFYCKRDKQRSHAQLDYHMMMVVHTCSTIKETTEMLERCKVQVDQKRHEIGPRLGFKTLEEVAKIRCRVVLIAWSDKYAPIDSRGYHALIKMCNTLNETTTASQEKFVSYEFYSVEELQKDISRGEKDGSVALELTNITPEETRVLKHTKVFEMRCVERLDAQSRIRDFRVGQTIRVTRKHILSGGITTEYLQVIDTSQ